MSAYVNILRLSSRYHVPVYSIFGNTDTSYVSVRYVISYSEILVIEYHPPAGAGVSVTAVDAGLRMQNVADFSGKGP